MRSFSFTLTLLCSLGGPALAAKIPPAARALASAPGVTELRVQLGVFPELSVSGEDLLLDGRETLAGPNLFSVRCGSTADGSFIDYGAGRVAAARLDVSAPGGFLRVNRKLYRNRIAVLARGEQCAVINTVDLEKYIAGLVNKEMVPSWPNEALKAQAVAARTYAVFQALANRAKDYDLDSSVTDQVYDGAESETPRSVRLTEATRGLVLAFGATPLKAYFHANCGGMTEAPVSVWGSADDAFRPVVCPYHQKKRDRQRWSLRLSRGQVEQALRKVSGLLPAGFRQLAHLEAGRPSPGQRLSDVVVSDAAGQRVLVPANQLRNALGSMRVKSTAFRIDENAQGFRLDGEGFGHGVGMCQVGARAMAEEGKSFRQILSYYYPLAQLRRF